MESILYFPIYLMGIIGFPFIPPLTWTGTICGTLIGGKVVNDITTKKDSSGALGGFMIGGTVGAIAGSWIGLFSDISLAFYLFKRTKSNAAVKNIYNRHSKLKK